LRQDASALPDQWFRAFPVAARFHAKAHCQARRLVITGWRASSWIQTASRCYATTNPPREVAASATVGSMGHGYSSRAYTVLIVSILLSAHPASRPLTHDPQSRPAPASRRIDHPLRARPTAEPVAVRSAVLRFADTHLGCWRQPRVDALLMRACVLRDLPLGASFEFDAAPGLIGQIAEVIDHQRACCQFLTLTLRAEHEAGPIVLEVVRSRPSKEQPEPREGERPIRGDGRNADGL